VNVIFVVVVVVVAFDSDKY